MVYVAFGRRHADTYNGYTARTSSSFVYPYALADRELALIFLLLAILGFSPPPDASLCLKGPFILFVSIHQSPAASNSALYTL